MKYKKGTCPSLCHICSNGTDLKFFTYHQTHKILFPRDVAHAASRGNIFSGNQTWVYIVEIRKLLGHESLEITMKYPDITTQQKLATLAIIEEEKNASVVKLWKQSNTGNARDYFHFV